MLRHSIFNLNELNTGLEILRKDLSTISEADDGNKFPILYDSSLSEFEMQYEHDDEESEESIYNSPNEQGHHKPCNILDALVSCNFYLNALSKERNSFFDNTMAPHYNNGLLIDLNKENDENIFSSEKLLKEYFETFKEKAWKSFAETNSFCKSLMTACKPLASHIVDADEVLHALKHSLEVYEQAITFDISCPDNAEKVLCALVNVKSSTRNLQSYLWMIKTLMTHSNK